MREEIKVLLNEYKLGKLTLDEAIERLILVIRYRD